MCCCTQKSALVAAVVASASRFGLTYHDDFLNKQLGGQTAAGGATVTTINPGSKDHPGILQFFLAAAADAALWTQNASLVPEILLGAGNTLTCEWDLSIPTLSNGVDNLTLRVGCGDSFAAADQANGIYFETDWANHGNANTWFACTANGGARTKVTLGVAPVAGVFVRLKFVANTTGVTFYVNDVALATIIANIPTAPISPVAQSVKQLGAGVMTVFLDYYDVTYTIPGGR